MQKSEYLWQEWLHVCLICLTHRSRGTWENVKARLDENKRHVDSLFYKETPTFNRSYIEAKIIDAHLQP